MSNSHLGGSSFPSETQPASGLVVCGGVAEGWVGAGVTGSSSLSEISPTCCERVSDPAELGQGEGGPANAGSCGLP